MIEAQVGRVVWEDLDVNTFIRFIQFAYLGDYPAPASGSRIDITLAAAPAAPVFTFCSLTHPKVWAETSFQDLDATKRKKSSPQMSKIKQEITPKPISGEYSFKDMDYQAHIPAKEFFKSCKPRPNHPSQDFTPVFLAHAELYVFADKYGINSLKQTVLHKLHKTLAIYTINPADIRAIIELIRYTFSDDNTLDLDNHVEDLRELVIAYIASEIKIIGKCGQFLALLEEGGAFVKKFWLTMMKKIP
ncbi:hypothetical protein MMC29_007548 [Sticta canariensis]|nr:hypothetical protein [Sticta canariensis]